MRAQAASSLSFILCLLAVGLGSAPAIDLRARSTSATGQFIIYCSDTHVRGRVAGFVEDTKTELLRLLGEPNRGKIPIVVALELAADPDAANSPVSVQMKSTVEGPTIHVAVALGRDPAAVHLQRHVLRALLLDFMYRERPPIQPGQPYAEAPWWLVSGVLEKFRQLEHGTDAALFRRLVETSRLPPIGEFLKGHGAELGGTAAAFDNACSFALVQLLLEQPEAKPRLAHFLRHWPDRFADPVDALLKAFPSIGKAEVDLEKWWTLNVARIAASDRYKGISATESDRLLDELLTIEVPLDKAGKKETFSIRDFERFIRLKAARTAAADRQKALVALSARANALLRPILADYESIYAQLARGRTKGIAARIERAERYRTAILHRTGEISDYLNWFEATQLGVRSGAFESYLRAAQAAESQPERSLSGQIIATYLDDIEAAL